MAVYKHRGPVTYEPLLSVTESLRSQSSKRYLYQKSNLTVLDNESSRSASKWVRVGKKSYQVAGFETDHHKVAENVDRDNGAPPGFARSPPEPGSERERKQECLADSATDSAYDTSGRISDSGLMVQKSLTAGIRNVLGWQLCLESQASLGDEHCAFPVAILDSSPVPISGDPGFWPAEFLGRSSSADHGPSFVK